MHTPDYVWEELDEEWGSFDSEFSDINLQNYNWHGKYVEEEVYTYNNEKFIIVICNKYKFNKSIQTKKTKFEIKNVKLTINPLHNINLKINK